MRVSSWQADVAGRTPVVGAQLRSKLTDGLAQHLVPGGQVPPRPHVPQRKAGSPDPARIFSSRCSQFLKNVWKPACNTIYQ